MASVIIPENVTNIGYCAFSSCTSLASIDIPECVTNIGHNAFYNCITLASINIPEKLTSVPYGVFQGCSSLTSVTIPEGITNIESYAFEGSGLVSVSFPESIKNIGSYAFQSCDMIKNVYAHSLISWCNIDFEDATANPLNYADRFYINNSIVRENLEIPSTITSLKPYVFTNCDYLESITFSNTSGLKDIGGCAFMDCDGLTSIDIPECVTNIGNNAFRGCI